MTTGDVLSIIGLAFAVLVSVVTFIVGSKLNEQKTQTLEASMTALKAETDEKVRALASKIDRVEVKAEDNHRDLNRSIDELKQLVAGAAENIAHIKGRLEQRRHE